MNLPKNLFLSQTEIGPLANYLYIIGDNEAKECALVDPAWDVPRLSRIVDENDMKVTSIFLTHGHPDHVNGLGDALKLYDVPVYISEHEAGFYTPTHKNIVKVPDGHILKTGNISWDCIHMPGHTPGCQSFKYEDVLIAGDVIFVDGTGRCDLPGGDPKVQYNTLYNILMNLPDSTIIFPGHNYGSSACDTLANQKKTNPYLTCGSEEEFLIQRMGYSF